MEGAIKSAYAGESDAAAGAAEESGVRDFEETGRVGKDDGVIDIADDAEAGGGGRDDGERGGGDRVFGGCFRAEEFEFYFAPWITGGRLIVGEMEFEESIAVGEDVVRFVAEGDANDRAGDFDGVEATISGENIAPDAFFVFFAFGRGGVGRFGVEIGGRAFTFAEDAAFEIKFF